MIKFVFRNLNSKLKTEVGGKKALSNSACMEVDHWALAKR